MRAIPCRPLGELDPASGIAVLEKDRPFSQSLLWRAQRAYFAREGAQAWSSDAVPSHITNHPAIAASYARIVRSIGGDDPVVVVDLGAGSGEFGFRFLKAWTGAYGERPVLYIMSDAEPAIVAALRGQPALRPFVERGLLDFAVFDAERDTALALEVRGRRLDAAAPAGRMVVVCNYVFDSLPEDAYLVREGAILERRVTTCATDAPGVPSLEHLELYFAEERARAPSSDPFLESLFLDYCERFGPGAFTWPCAALRACQALHPMASDGALFLIADKGTPGRPRGEALPRLSWHGSVSTAVNLHALSAYFDALGAAAWNPLHATSHLYVYGYALGLADDVNDAAREIFAESFGRQHPDDRMALQLRLCSQAAKLPIDEVLALLRWSGGDDRILLACAPALRARVGELSALHKMELRRLLGLAADLHYPAGPARELPAAIAQLLIDIGAPARAV